MEGTERSKAGSGAEGVRERIVAHWRAHPRSYLLLVLAVGIAIHLPIFSGALSVDTCVQLDMAHSLLDSGHFTVEGEPSNFFPPMMSLLMAPFIAVGGDHPHTLHLFQLVLFSIALLVVYCVGKQFGRAVGFFAAIAFAVDPIIYGTMTATLSEVLVTLLFVSTFAAIVRGLNEPRWMMLAGFLAGIAYLTKASAGYLVLVAGAAGLLWRFAYERWELLHNKSYILGIVVFFSIVSPWMIRNYRLFGYIWNGRYATESIHYFLSLPLGTALGYFARYLLIYMGWLLLISSPVLLSRRVVRNRRRILRALRRSQAYSGLALFILGTLLIGAFMAAALSAYTPASEALPHIRYIAVVDPLVVIALGIVVTRIIDNGDRRGGRQAQDELDAGRMPRVGAITRCVAVIVVLAVLIPPNHAVYSYRDQYDTLAAYLDAHNATTIWSNTSVELRYNLPERFEIEPFDRFDAVPPNATVVAVRGLPAGVEPDRVLTFSTTKRPWLFIVLDWNRTAGADQRW